MCNPNLKLQIDRHDRCTFQPATAPDMIILPGAALLPGLLSGKEYR
ncbi:MAG: hypothetical protein L3J49_02700 [Desulfobulbaceae bacterium]|nr:hypothetical protein [Desulfobulbaceae bacterium]